MKPSIGRIVLFTIRIYGVLVERPAIITSVRRNGSCGLHVFREEGDEEQHGIEPYAVGFESDVPTEGCWRWPPREPLKAKSVDAS